MSSVNDTKFCTSCQTTRSVEGGELRVTRGVNRWICLPCIQRRSESIYKSQREDAVKAREKNK